MSNDLQTTVLDALCPMHVWVGPTGHITHAGPTAAKLSPDAPLIGQRFLEAFALTRPRQINDLADLRNARLSRLHLETRDTARTALRGVAVPLGGPEAGMIVNLSFGISIAKGVRDYALSNADFAVTDLAIEMLYLIEAKTAAMDASRRLNLRLEGARIAAQEQAYTDTLTGLKNRRALHTVLQRLTAGNTPFAVMQIDLDYFKTVNDTLGHAAGDHVLQKVAHIMVDETRSADTVARVGGDEFCIVLPDVRSDAVLRAVGRRIISRLEQPIPFGGVDCRISASIGTVWIQSGEAATLEELLDNADVALYASKNAGRAQQTFYAPHLRTGPSSPT